MTKPAPAGGINWEPVIIILGGGAIFAGFILGAIAIAFAGLIAITWVTTDRSARVLVAKIEARRDIEIERIRHTRELT